MIFLGPGLQKLEHYRRTDRQAGLCDCKHCHAAFVGSNKVADVWDIQTEKK